MGDHLVEVDGVLTFQSDKYPTCPPGKVPLSVKDKDAQPFLWAYAEIHEKRDPEFSADVKLALINAGYKPGKSVIERMNILLTDAINAVKSGKGLPLGFHFALKETRRLAGIKEK
jgi:hypothetical protein